jgi:hypothetical protein
LRPLSGIKYSFVFLALFLTAATNVNGKLPIEKGKLQIAIFQYILEAVFLKSQKNEEDIMKKYLLCHI